MVWACTYAVQAEAVRKAGANANATAVSAAYTLAWGQQVEGIINCLTNFNWSDQFTTGINDAKVGLLTDCASNLVAIYILNYDLNAYPARTVEFMINMLWAGFWRDIKLLQGTQGATFVQANP